MPNQNQNKSNEETNSKINQKQIKITNNPKISKTGLKNFVDTSYLNEVLQLLGHIQEFAAYFLNRKNEFISESNIKEKPLSFAI
jgi:ubiquitin C-terminal hydrolase